MLSTWKIPEGTSLSPTIPVNLQLAGLATDWCSLTDLVDAEIVVVMEDGPVSPVIVCQQATSKAGAGAKTLPITDIKVLAAVDFQNPTSSETWETYGQNSTLTVNRTSPADSVDLGATSGADDKQVICVIRIHEANLDANNGFTHFRLNVAAVAGAAVRTSYAFVIAKDRMKRGFAKENDLS